MALDIGNLRLRLRLPQALSRKRPDLRMPQGSDKNFENVRVAAGVALMPHAL